MTPSREVAARVRAAARRRARAAVLAVAGPRAQVSTGVHILAGHSTGAPGPYAPEAFARMLDLLASRVDLVRVEDAVELIRRRVDVDRPKVAFTFDDGYLDTYQHLAPALEAHDINAAFFINSRYIGADPDYVEHFNRERIHAPGSRPMTAAMVAELADRGFVIGGHTCDHVMLDTADPVVLDDQIVTCKAEVEALSGKPCDWFAWPYGTYRDVSDAAIELAGDTYDVVFSSDRYPSYTSHDGRVLNRRHFETFWPESDVRFFLRKPRIH